MVWYRYLYVDEDMKQKTKRIKWKILHSRNVENIFLITLSEYPQVLLEILSVSEKRKKFYPKKNCLVVGVAKGYEESCNLACSIIMDVYGKTGGFQVKEYLLKKHFQGKEKGSKWQ